MVDGRQLTRGDVYLADIYFCVDKKWKPRKKFVVIVEKFPEIASPTVAVLTLTTQKLDQRYPSDVFVSPEECNSERGAKILSNQPSTIPKDQLIKFRYSLSEKTIHRMNSAIVNVLGL